MTAPEVSCSGTLAAVDAHVHVSGRRPAGPSSLVAGAPVFDAPVAELFAAMAPAGVAQAVLVQPTMHGLDHRQLVRALAAYPGRTRGVAIADPRAPRRAGQLRSLAAGGLITGVRLLPLAAPAFGWLDDDCAWIADVAADLGLCVEVLTGPESLAKIGRLARRRPELTIVIEHLGRTDLRPADGPAELLRLAGHASVHVKASALHSLSREPFPYRDTWPLLRAVCAEFGAGRLMWGSDFPFVATANGYAEARGAVELALPQLDAAERGLLFGGTARAVYQLPDPPPPDPGRTPPRTPTVTQDPTGALS
jgi:predicted TIM-barrel fold metal-dependent hydrolase